MKNKSIFILLIIVLLLASIFVGSLYFVDGITLADIGKGDFQLGFINDGFSINYANQHLVDEEDNIGPIEKLESENFNGVLTIYEGENKISFYSKDPNLKVDNYYDYTIKDGILEIVELDSLPISKECNIVLSLEDTSQLDLDIENLDGVLTIDGDISSIKSDYLRGVLTLDGQINNLSCTNLEGVYTSDSPSSYNIDIDNAEGVITIACEDLNAVVNIEDASGLITISSEDYDSLSIDGGINKTFGQGRDRIDMKNASGIITISDWPLFTL